MKRIFFAVDEVRRQWNERRWAMVKTTRVAFVATLVGLATGVCLSSAIPSAQALTTSDSPSAILVWPKIVVDSEGRFNTGPTDTVVQLSNTSTTDVKQAHCFYVNANSHCADTGAVCLDAEDCPASGGGFAACLPGWSEIDFQVVLTRDQPVSWFAGSGLQRGDFPLEGPGHCTNIPARMCIRDADCGPPGTCDLGQNNLGSAVPPAPEDPFVGSLKCIEYTSGNPPVPDTTNTLKGEGSIMTVPFINASAPEAVDVQKYNAVGLRSTGISNPPLNVLQIGGSSGAEYQACPTTLILNHLFDGATDPISDSSVITSDLTLVPCGDDYLRQIPGRVTAQFLVFNEFEQRFSTSRTVDCFFERLLSNIDTPNNSRSIFSAGVSGTIAGQTRIRGVGDASTGRGLIGVARVFFSDFSGAAYNLHEQGNPDATVQPDIITLP
jgi:hypothetical protein